MIRHRLLAIAYHFPPIQGSSGVHRVLSLARHLPQHAWDVTVLTVTPGAYQQSRVENLALVPDGSRVIRVPALDASRHLSIHGRYPGFLALPDRWQSWIPGAIVMGLRAVRRERPAALLSTFPIASAHVIGLALKRLTGLPWIADFRDPMYQVDYPDDQRIRRVYRRLERSVVQAADRVLVTTAGTARLYRDRYRDANADKVMVLENGFDPAAFPAAAMTAPVGTPRPALRLLHSGLLYPSERDPRPFFAALASLVRAGVPTVREARFVFRGSGYEQQYQPLVDELGLGEQVQFLPALPYREALAEMLAADGLLLFQAANCNDQIPAKAYEYLYAQRPVLAFTDPNGDTAGLLRRCGINSIAPLDDAGAISTLLANSLPRIAAGTMSLPSADVVNGLSRTARAAELAEILSDLLPAA